jgi:hypothetical protein
MQANPPRLRIYGFWVGLYFAWDAVRYLLIARTIRLHHVIYMVAQIEIMYGFGY